MTGTQRNIRVAVVTPSLWSGAVRALLYETAMQAGISYCEQADHLKARSAAPQLLVCEDASEAARVHPSHAVVLFGATAYASSVVAARHGVSGESAWRYAARCLALATDFAAASSATVLLDSAAGEQPHALTNQLLAALGLDPVPDRQLPRPDEPSRQQGPNEVTQLLALYEDGPPTPGSQSVWAPHLLRSGDRPDETCPDVLDVTGRARIVLFGPLVDLPAGTWRLTAEFHLCPEAARHPLLLQFGVGANLAAFEFQPSGPGHFKIGLDHSWLAPGAAELRLSVPRAIFHGELRFQRATVEMLEAPPSRRSGAHASPQRNARSL